MSDGGSTVFDGEFDVEVFDLLVIELSAIIYDDGLRKAKLIDDRLPYELLGFSFSDLSHWLGFHPFGEVVYGDKQELSLCQS